MVADVHDDHLQSRHIARFGIASNAYYFRFFHPLRGNNIARYAELASELVFGADVVDGTKSGLAIKTFLRILDAAGAEVVLPLLPKQEVKPGLASHASTLSFTPEQLSMLRESKSAQYAIEITGTGTLLMGLAWLGDANLVAARSKRLSAASDTGARDWHYSRYVETVETLFLPIAGQPDLAACVAVPQSYLPEHRNQAVAATIRSLIKHTAKIRIVVPASTEKSADVGGEIQQHLLEVVSLREMARIDVKTFASDKEAEHLFSDFVKGVTSDCFVVTFVAGSLVPKDFANAIGVAALGQKKPDFVVFDHDTIGASGHRTAAAIKPGLSRHLLLETDYIGPAVAFRAEALQRAISEGALSPVLPFGTRDVLLHFFDWSLAGTKLDAVLLNLPVVIDQHSPAEERLFIEKVLLRRGRPATVSRWGSELNVQYKVPHSPLVSIIVLFRDKVEYLKRCVESLRTRTSYRIL